MFNNAQMVEIGGKEVKSIVLQDGGVLYEKENLINEPLVVHFVGTNFSSITTDPFTGRNITIDWGDGTITNYTPGDAFKHTYEDNTEHIIRISNITEVKQQAFYDTNLTKVFVPSNIISLGAGAFTNCQSLEQIILSEGLKSIGFNCFAVCGNKDNLMDITIPSSVTSIDTECFLAAYITKMNFLWDTSESIIPYNSEVYRYPHPDLTFYIPEGTTQLYVDKGYPLAKLVEGATSITLTSNTDVVGIGEIATITGTLNYPSKNKVIVFNTGTGTPEDVRMTPGNNYYSIGENGFDILDFSKSFYLESNIDDGAYLSINYSNSMTLSVQIRLPNEGMSYPVMNSIPYPIKLHVDENNIILYAYTDTTRKEIQCLIKNKSNYMYFENIEGKSFPQWKLSGDNPLTVAKNAELYLLTDSNGQVTTEYEGVGTGDITITGTYLEKNVSDSITIKNVVAHDVGYGSYFMNSKWLSRTIESDGVLITDNHPDSASEFDMWYMYILPNHQQATSMSECNIWESDKDYCIEMDIIDSDASNAIQLRLQASSGKFLHSQEISQLNDTTPFHLKIIVSGGISYWFVDDNNSPIYIENSIDLGESYGIRIGIMKQQSLKFNNLIVYELDEPFVFVPVQSGSSLISIQSNKTVISAVNNESCILNATVLDRNNNPIQNQEVTFKLGTTILDTALTDENGEATYEFEAKGNGNISVSAEVGELSSNSLTIEDCIYAKMQQYDIVRSGSTVYGFLNDDVISDLPIQYSIEYSMKTSRNPESGSEHRLYWVPRELYNNGNQPSYAMFIGFAYSSAYSPCIQYGVRRGNTSCVERSCSIDSWYNFKVDKLSDRFNYYNNGSFIDWYSFGYQYNNWTFSYIVWSDTTLSVKNIKIKPFEFNDTISIEYSETETNYTLTATLTGNDIANRAVRFYKNNKYIGTSFTDSNGIATKTFDEIENEDMSFTAWCGNVESSEVIVENDISTPKIKLSADKNILSYADNESCTITAIYQGETVSRQTVVFKNGETVLATKTTNSNGVATYEYESQGIGNITITAECMNLQKTFTIEDCKYFNDGSSVGLLEVGSGVTCTSNGEYITITTNSSGEKDVKVPITLSGDWEFKTTIGAKGTTQDATFKIDTTGQWGTIVIDDNIFAINLGDGTQQYTQTIQVGDTFKVNYVNGELSVFLNNNLITSKVCNISGKIGYYTNNGRVQHIKNIKLKPL